MGKGDALIIPKAEEEEIPSNLRVVGFSFEPISYEIR